VARRADIFVHVIETPGAPTMWAGTGALVGVPALLLDPGAIRLSAFPNGPKPGLISRNLGEAVYSNADGRYDSALLGVAVSGGTVTCYRGPPDGEFPGDFTTIEFIAYIEGTPRFTPQMPREPSKMILKLRGRDALFAARVCQLGFDWALNEAAGGRFRPYRFGTPGMPAPILITPFEAVEGGNEWFVQLNPPTDIDYVTDGGRLLTNQGEASSRSDLTSGAVNPASYRWWYDDGSGDPINEGLWIRLGSKVYTELRYIANSPTITISDLAIMAGVADAATMAAGSVDLSVGSVDIETETYNDVLEDVARANLSLLGFSTGDKLWQRYIVPTSAEDYETDFVFTDNGDTSKNWEVSTPDAFDRRFYEVRVNAGRTQQGQLAGIPNLDGAAAEMLARENWLTTFVGSAQSVRDEDTHAESMTIDIQANHFAGDLVGMEEFAAKVLGLFGGVHVWYVGIARDTPEAAALQLMDKVTLTGSRLGMAGERFGRIVTIDRSIGRFIRFGIWAHFSEVAAEDVELTSVDDGTTATPGASLARGTGRNVHQHKVETVNCSDEVTPIAVGLLKTIANWGQDNLLCGIEAGLKTAQATGSTFTIDIDIDGVSAFSTLLTIANTETQSEEGTQATLALLEIPKGSKVEIYCTQVGDGTAVGLHVMFKVMA
jgi:hypothetical protein